MNTELKEIVKLHLAGDLASAERGYRKLIDEQSTSHVVYGNLGSICLNTGRAAEAIPLLRQALEIKPDYPLAYYNLGLAFQELGNLKEAQGAYESAVQIKPDYAEAYQNLGTVLQEQEQLDEAIAAYNCALQIKPDYAEAYYNLGTVFQVTDLLDQAIAAYNRALEFKPDHAPAYYNLGIVFQVKELFDEAIASYQCALQIKPDYAEAYQKLGMIFHHRKSFEDAVTAYNYALQFNPDSPETYYNLGLVLKDLGKVEEAMNAYNRALELQPDTAEAYYNLGTALRDLGKLEEAVAVYNQALELKPDYAEVYNSLGVVLKDLGKLEEAKAAYHRAIEIQPDYAEAYSNLGVLYQEEDNLEEAIAAHNRAIELKPDHAGLYYNLGTALQQQESLEEAITAYERAVELNPDYAEAYNNLGITRYEQGLVEEAISAYERAVEIKPDFALGYGNLGKALIDRGKRKEAIEALNNALKYNPDYFEAYHNLGIVFLEQRELEKAVTVLNQALEINPDCAGIYYTLGIVLKEQKKLDEAAESFSKALNLDPDLAMAISQYVDCCAQLFQIEVAKPHLEHGYSLLEAGPVTGFSPWSLLAQEDATPQIQKKAGFYYGEFYLPPKDTSSESKDWEVGNNTPHKRTKQGKIRLGYISVDFTNHPVMYLITDILQNYDRNKFEVYCYCITKEIMGELRDKIKNSVDKFVELSDLIDDQAAEKIAEDDLDILVDLTGYTRQCRPGIVARRPAPIIVNWLGYAGTMGHPQLADYIIGDPIVTPLENGDDFSERIIQMPHCYLPAPYPPLENIPSRAQVGLPEDKIVFCSFNQSLKISPSCFEAWCVILSLVPHSVLWLSLCAPIAQKNIFTKALEHEIHPSRIIFAPRTHTREQHLARLTLADIALDTFPYNSHSTGADILWAGVPMVTLLGETFAGRVGASLVTAVGLPELVTTSLDAYCELAVELALNPQALGELRTKLWNNRTTQPLFNSQQFITDLEKLYQQLIDDC